MITHSASRVSTLATASRAVARVVARHPDIQAAYIFGSVAQGRARPDSDIDVAVLLGRRLPDARALRYRLTLVGELGAALHITLCCRSSVGRTSRQSSTRAGSRKRHNTKRSN